MVFHGAKTLLIPDLADALVGENSVKSNKTTSSGSVNKSPSLSVSEEDGLPDKTGSSGKF